jgi:hypothetical protein
MDQRDTLPHMSKVSNDLERRGDTANDIYPQVRHERSIKFTLSRINERIPWTPLIRNSYRKHPRPLDRSTLEVHLSSVSIEKFCALYP